MAKELELKLKIGDVAPAFTVATSGGGKISLADYQGKNVILYFYPKDDTPGCTKEACQFNDELSAFSALGALVLGISPDGAAAHQAFKKKFGLNFALLSDPEKTVMAKYGAYGEKMLYGKKVNGVIRSTFVVSGQGLIEHAFYNVRADGHAAKVLATLSR